ncbi:MAG: hypothetical protein AAF843_11380 [Bacteroidota bacterium]
MEYDSLYAIYDKDFRIGLNPVQITQGKVEFYYKDTRIVYADPSGFHPDWTAFGNAFIPEKIPLPTEEIAYIKIKENDRLLVDISQDQQGNTIVSTKAGQPVTLHLPAFKSEPGQVPQIAVDFNRLLLDAGSGAVIGGSLVATVPDNDPLFDLTKRGIPITPKFIAFGVNEQGGTDVSGLFIRGHLNLFKSELGEPATVIAGIQSDGRLRAAVSLPGLNVEAPLEDYANHVALNFKSVVGTIEIPLLGQNSIPNINLSLDADFQLYNQENDFVAAASFKARYKHNDLSIEQFVGSVNNQNSSLNIDPFIFRIDALNHLNLAYSEQDGISFDAGLDCKFGYKLEGGDAFEFPLKQVELSSTNGITIPVQDIHDGTAPGFDPPIVDFGIFRLDPLALRLPAITFNWWSWQVGMPLGFDPKIDLELSFPGLVAEAPEFALSKLTLNDVGFENGILNGSMVPFSFPGDGVPLPIGGDLKLNVKEIGGLLKATAENAQDFLIDLKGKLKYPDFLKKNQICTEADISIKMDRLGYFSGQIQDFTPCGQLEQGPLTLKFNATELNFAVGLGKQKATIAGSATALIKRKDNVDVNATGNVAFDLINGKLLDGKILLTGPFDWQYTERDSLFSFIVQTAELDTVGLKFKGNGSLALGNGSSNLTFNNPTFSLQNGRLIDGNIKIQNSFALDVALNPIKWSVESPSAPTQNVPGIRLTMPADLMIDKNGLTVNDSSVASLNYADKQYDLLKVHFDNFNLGLDPVQVNSGKASFFLDSLNGSDPIEIAWYDKTGFHLDDGTNLIKAVLPDTLFLPTEEIAYIVLRDQNGTLMVDIESDPQGKKLNTRAPLPLVINSFDKNDPMTADVRLFDLIINDGFEVVQGYIEGDLTNNPINLGPTEDIPLKLTKIAYFKDQNKPYSLYADATLVLPESLNEVEVKLERIEFGASGFKSGTITSGTYSTTYDPNLTPIASHSFTQGEFTFAVGGVELDFREGYQTYRISGQVGSNLFRDASNTPSLLHYTGYYDTDLGWEIDLTGAALPVISINQATLTIDAFETEITNQGFSVVMDGRFQMEELMGKDFEASIQDLTIGTNGVSLAQVNSNAIQYLDLLNQVKMMKITNLGLGIESNNLNLILDGSLHFMERDLLFADLKIGSDGSFSIGSANANLLNGDFEVLGEYLILQQVNLVAVNNKVALQAVGEVNLPEPFTQNDRALSIEIDHLGSVSVDMPSIGVDDIPVVELGDFAELKITEVAVELDPIVLQNTWFFASANLDIPDKESNTINTIEFGTPNGNYNDAGISYQYGDGQLRWKITKAPDFEFDQTFFKLNVSNISASGGNGFEVSMDAEASLQFDEVGGSGRVEDILINKDGLTWGRFAGATFSFVDVVTIEVGSFEYFSNGGTINIEKGTQKSDGKPTTEVEELFVDEYLKFGNALGNALKVSITESEGFNVSGSIKEIVYYRKSDELYFTVKDVDVKLHDYVKLYASLEYKKDPTGFLLRVAGAAKITPPGGDEIGVVAVGKLATINNKFSFGVFVAVEGVPIPIIPAIVEINKIGGGFFYNAEQADLEMVLNASGYQPANPNFNNVIMGESKFAIIFYGGVGIIGTAGTYNFSGTMLMLIKPGTLALDATFEMLSAPIEGGAYFTMQLSDQKFELEAGGKVKLKDLGVVKGALGVNFTAIKLKGQDNVEWAFTGGTTVAGGEPIEIVNILEANATVIVSQDGFLLDCSVGAGFDVWIVSVKGGLEATVWYLAKQQQFGAFAKINVEVSVLGGLAKLGGDALGALILERGDFLIYASLTGYVEVAFVFEGDMTAWLSIQKSGFDAGLGKSGYEDIIAQARENAQNLNDKAEELLTSIEEAKNAILPLSTETLAKSGQALYMASSSDRTTWANQFIQNERKIKNPPHSAFEMIKNEIIDGGRPKDTQRQSFLTEMKTALREANQAMDDILPKMLDLEASAIEWKEQSVNSLANLQDPVNKIMFWQGDIAPSFSVDTIQAQTNLNESATLKENINSINEETFMAAIDTTLANIHRIELMQDGKTYSLATSPSFNSVNIRKTANKFTAANRSIRKYYATQISYFWALHRWSKNKIPSLNLTNSNGTGPLDLANLDVLRRIGITYRPNKYPLPTQYGSYTDELVSNGISIQGGYVNGSYTTNYNNLSSTNMQRFRQGILDKERNLGISISSVIAQRLFLVQKMNPDIDLSAATTARNSLQTNINQLFSGNKYLSFIKAINGTSNDILLMQTLGLGAIRDMAKTKADSLVIAADNVLNDLDNKYGKFTSLQNNIYQIKHNMLVNLHGMYDLYALWKKDRDGEGAATDIEQLQMNIETILTSPKINEISIITKKGRNGFDREVLAIWNASHPYSEGIVENSYQIQNRRSDNIYARNFRSTGKDKLVYHHMYSDDEIGQSKYLTLRVRVRGPGGNTVSRYAQKNVALGPLAPDRVTTDWDALKTDTSPPSPPLVSPNYKKNQPSGYSEKKYWSNDPSKIEINILANDYQSDIAKVEYAIGTSKGGTDIVDWKVGQTTGVLSGNNSFGNMAKKMVARYLNLQPNVDYYISARVTNGEGLVSPVKENSTPLRLDLTGPGKVTELTQLSTTSTPFLYLFNNTSYQPNVVTERPAIEPPVQVTGAIPKIDVNWQEAEDDLSGVRGYEYIVSKHSDPLVAYETDEVEWKYKSSPRRIYLSGNSLSFEDTVYIHIWAVDYADNKSKEPLTLTRLPKDNTAPSTPITTVMSKTDGLSLFIKRPSFDPESRVKGIQYAVGSWLYTSNIKSWPQGSAHDNLSMDIGSKFIRSLWQAYTVGEYSRWAGSYDAPYFEIPASSLPEGEKLYITYRTINGQNMISATSASGPVILDSSAPTSPSVTLSFVNGQLKIEAKGIKDDQSGIKRIEYTVQNKNINVYYAAWSSFTSISTIRTVPFDHTRNVSWTTDMSLTRVGLRLTNGNGMQSTYWFDGQQYGQILIQQDNTGNSGAFGFIEGFNFNWNN